MLEKMRKTTRFSSFGSASNLSKTSAETSKIVSAELLEEPSRLFEHDVSLDVNYTFLEYTMCSGKSNRVENSIAQLARIVAWITIVVTCLTE